MIGLGGNQVIDHVDSGGKERFIIFQTGLVRDGLGQAGFSCSGLTDKDDIFFFVDKITLH